MKHSNGAGQAQANEKDVTGKRPSERARKPGSKQELPTLGGGYPDYEPWRRALVADLYADSGDAE